MEVPQLSWILISEGKQGIKVLEGPEGEYD